MDVELLSVFSELLKETNQENLIDELTEQIDMISMAFSTMGVPLISAKKITVDDFDLIKTDISEVLDILFKTFQVPNFLDVLPPDRFVYYYNLLFDISKKYSL